MSRIELDTSRLDTRRAIASPQVFHAAVEGCFPEVTSEKQRKLWRLDFLHERMYLLLLSPEQPNFSSFSKQFCTSGANGDVKDYYPLLRRIQTGQNFHFRLRGNPVHSVSSEKGVRGKIYAHVTVEQQRDWLIKKAPAYGFGLTYGKFDVIETRLLRFWRARNEQPVEISTAVYEGWLEVTDTNLFINALTQGIGRAKAYGCGLLTVMAQQ